MEPLIRPLLGSPMYIYSDFLTKIKILSKRGGIKITLINNAMNYL